MSFREGLELAACAAVKNGLKRMIISASRRTDIPAFYSRWFMNRVQEGFCLVPNPFNRRQVSNISLRPEDVDVLVFWTRNPRPMLPHLEKLDGMGYRYVFLYTILNNPRALDPGSPAVEASLETFRELASRLGPERMTWRYDPIVFSNLTSCELHKESFGRIAEALRGSTHRAIISTVKLYRKSLKRLQELAQEGVHLTEPGAYDREALGNLMKTLLRVAEENDMTLTSCADEVDLLSFGVPPGRCIDGSQLAELFDLVAVPTKDPSQRKECGCAVSRDVGMYDSCLFGCRYCYANVCFERSRANFEAHDPLSPVLIGHPG